MPVSQADVVEALRPVQDPELRRSIVELGMVRDITVAEASVEVQVALTVPGCPLKAEITEAVKDRFKDEEGTESAAETADALVAEVEEFLRRSHNDHEEGSPPIG